MIRRHFIRLMTLAGVSGLTDVHAATNSNETIVHYKISGFTCVTCAVGLDTMLQRQKGVVWSQSSYRDAMTNVSIHPGLTNDECIRNAIEELGFIAERVG